MFHSQLWIPVASKRAARLTDGLNAQASIMDFRSRTLGKAMQRRFPQKAFPGFKNA